MWNEWGGEICDSGLILEDWLEVSFVPAKAGLVEGIADSGDIERLNYLFVRFA